MQCIYAAIGIQICYVCYILESKPHIDQSYNSLEIFNEICMLLFFYALLSFQTSSIAPIVPPEYQWIIGFLTMGLVCMIYAVNFFLMLKEIYKKMRQLYQKAFNYIQKKITEKKRSKLMKPRFNQIVRRKSKLEEKRNSSKTI